MSNRVSINGLCDFKDWTPTVEGMISYYTCVYQNENITVGKKSSKSKILTSKKPEHWTTLNTQIIESDETNEKNVFVGPARIYFPCTGYQHKAPITTINVETGIITIPNSTSGVLKGGDHNSIQYDMHTLQKKCVGYISKEGQSLSKYKFPDVSPGKIITADTWNLILGTLKMQIETRMASNKYKKIYEALDEQDKPLNIVENITAPLLDHKINKKIYLDKLVTAIKNLQPKNKIGTISETKYKFKVLTHRRKSYPIPEWLTKYQPFAYSYDNNPNEKLNVDDILLSRNNINLIIDAIKADINDCICYSDCNGYQVCWCHGNCVFMKY